ncbi:MAG: UDP-2,3-diacylglucosamine diphosphatase [Bacteroidales bacterium]|mgnify:FL=1|nr:UDP-2,3-diacylglucosamine diphosphatase [Bacteroidales bacterium]
MIYFLSDAHLGSLAIEKGWAHQKKLIDMLEEMSKDAASIYMLGDMFDFWMEYFIHDKRKHQYAPFFKELRKLSKQGIHVHIFTGNHDLWTFGGMAQLSYAEIHYEPCTILRYGKAIYLAHGDGLLPSNWESLYPKDVKKKIKRFMRLKDIFRSPFLQFCFRCLPPSWGNKFGYEWAKRSRLKEIAKPCPYKGEDKEELVLFAKEQEKQHNHRDYYIFGHRHIELDLQISKDSRVVILGDCFKEFTYAKLDHKGNLTLHNYEQ